MVKLTEKMSNELKRLKNQFSDFFFTYGRFWTKKIDQFWALSELRIYRQITQFFFADSPPLSFDPVLMDDAECAE